MRRTISFTAAAVLLSAATASAQPVRVTPVALPADAASTRDALSLWSELTVAVQRDARLKVETLDMLNDPEPARVRAENLGHGHELLRKAEQTRKEQGLAAAQPLYVEAAELLAESDWRQGFDAWLTARAWKAAATGEQQDLSLLFTLRPDWQFPPNALEPTRATAIEEQRQGKARAVRGAFEVKSAVEALVWIDGVLVGPTPVRSPELVAGRHFITAFAPGYQLAQQKELVGPGSVVQLDLVDLPDGPTVRSALAELSAALRNPDKTPSTHLHRLLKVDEVVVASPTPAGEVTVLRIDKDGRVARKHRAAAASERAATVAGLARDAWDDTPAAVGATMPTGGAPIAVEQPVAAPPSRMPSVVLMAAGGAAVVAGGVLFGVTQGQAAAAQQIPQTQDAEYREAIGAAQMSAAGSYALMGVGVAAAVAGAVMWFTSAPASPAAPAEEKKRDEERDPFGWMIVPGPGSVSIVGRF